MGGHVALLSGLLSICYTVVRVQMNYALKTFVINPLIHIHQKEKITLEIAVIIVSVDRPLLVKNIAFCLMIKISRKMMKSLIRKIMMIMTRENLLRNKKVALIHRNLEMILWA